MNTPHPYTSLDSVSNCRIPVPPLPPNLQGFHRAQVRIISALKISHLIPGMKKYPSQIILFSQRLALGNCFSSPESHKNTQHFVSLSFASKAPDTALHLHVASSSVDEADPPVCPLQTVSLLLHKYSCPATPRCQHYWSMEQVLEAILLCLIVPERSGTPNSLLPAGHTDAVEILCTFGKHAYFRILFRNESLLPCSFSPLWLCLSE